MSSLGLVQVYTGEGKGKSTAAFGLALRAWGRGLRVCIIQFLKLGEDYGEVQAVRRLAGIDLMQFGGEHFVRKGRHRKEDAERARAGLEKAKEALTSGRFDLVILDEVNVAVDFGLLGPEEVLEAVRSRGEVEVVLTGRNAPQAFLDEADLVTEMRMVKHPYDQGVEARPGIEF
ncbi:MAG: cob(I)yrinic acid a,c-diamide adenosyltransferase [Methanomassiliicoccales archaeon]|jgi:cob(I)alamin adenosyltransferase|nr:cob(I)yrinic acid a,c-diamide adenosyltransferase [Methanomassiliicoccales archaeon]